MHNLPQIAIGSIFGVVLLMDGQHFLGALAVAAGLILLARSYIRAKREGGFYAA